MAPFKGKEAVRLSPLLSGILEQIEAEQLDSEGSRKALAVAELSRLFTKERDSLAIGYLNDPGLAAAYLSYFFPVNLCKIQVLLDELPDDWYKAPADRALQVLDLGAGPGTGALAVLDWLNQHDPDSLKGLTVVAVDASADALRQARLLWTAYSRLARRSDASLILHEGDVARPANQGWRHAVVSRAPYDLVLVSNCLNELFGGTSRAIKERIGLVADLLAGEQLGAEVVDASHQVHERFQGLRVADQCSTASHQDGQASAEGGVQAFDEGSVDLGSAAAFY